MQQAAEHQRPEPDAHEEAAGEESHGRAAGRGRELGRLGLHRVVQHVVGEPGAEHRRGISHQNGANARAAKQAAAPTEPSRHIRGDAEPAQ